MGNSEVGHLNIGAGRVVMQDLPRISDAVAIGRDRARAGAHRPDREAQAERRHLPSARPGFARRRAFAPGPRGGAGEDPRRGRRADGGACLHRRPRHAAAIGRRRSEAAHRRAAAVGAGRDRDAAATTPWTATSAGSAWRRPTTPWSKPKAPRFPDPQAAIADAYAHKQFDEFIVPAVIGDYRGMQGRRRRAVLQLPRRPRARNPRRHARSGVLRLSAQARGPLRRRRRHDAILATSSTG